MKADIAFLLDRPIAFHRIFARVGGSVNAGVFLSQAVYWSDRTSDMDGWFWKTQDQWEDETCLSRKEQETARRHLRNTGVLEEKKQGTPCKLYFRVNFDKLSECITEYTNKNVLIGQTRNADEADKPLRSDIQSIYIDYSENTSESSVEDEPKTEPIALPSTQKTIEANQSEPTTHPVNSPIPGKGNVPARGATHSRTSFGLEDREWACHAAPWRESVATWKDSMLEAVFRSDKKYYSLNKDGAKRDNRHCESLLRRLEQAAQVYHGHPEIEANALHSRRELLRFWEDAQGLAPSAMAIASPTDGDWTKHPKFQEWRNECLERGTSLFVFVGGKYDETRGAFVDWALQNGIFEVSA